MIGVFIVNQGAIGFGWILKVGSINKIVGVDFVRGVFRVGGNGFIIRTTQYPGIVIIIFA